MKTFARCAPIYAVLHARYDLVGLDLRRVCPGLDLRANRADPPDPSKTHVAPNLRWAAQQRAKKCCLND
jgi:hypothetical protein